MDTSIAALTAATPGLNDRPSQGAVEKVTDDPDR
jgi:hypothetical protein